MVTERLREVIEGYRDIMKNDRCGSIAERKSIDQEADQCLADIKQIENRIEELLDANNRMLERARAAEALAQERLDGLLAAARFTTTMARELKLEGLER